MHVSLRIGGRMLACLTLVFVTFLRFKLCGRDSSCQKNRSSKLMNSMMMCPALNLQRRSIHFGKPDDNSWAGCANVISPSETCPRPLWNPPESFMQAAQTLQKRTCLNPKGSRKSSGRKPQNHPMTELPTVLLGPCKTTEASENPQLRNLP